MKKIIFISLGFIFASHFAFADDIRYIISENGSISVIPEAQVESKCAKNFVFREKDKDKILPYLARELIKAAFKNELSPSLDSVISTLKSNSGKCSWLSAGENL